MREKGEKRNVPIKLLLTRKDLIFVVLLLAGECLYWLVTILTNSQFINSYFHNLNMDTFMDYFNMLQVLVNPHYEIYETKVIYPALCFCLWDIAFAMIPYSYRGLSSVELRNYQPALLGFVLCLLITVIAIWVLIKKNYKGYGVQSDLFALSILFSGPILFSIERGNIILLALVFLLLFELFYNSKNKYLRYLSYIALALSASIKIYPALFGVLIISHKRWKEVFGAIAIGVLIFVIPFLYLCGWEGVISMYKNIVYASPILANRGMGYIFSFANLMKIIQTFSGSALIKGSIMLKVIPSCIALFIFLTNKDEWKKMFAIVLLFVWIHEFSSTYTLIFFILPLISYLNVDDGNKISIIDHIYTILYVIMFLPTATATFPEVDVPGALFPLSGSVMIVHGVIVAFSLLLIIDGISALIKKGKNRNNLFIMRTKDKASL